MLRELITEKYADRAPIVKALFVTSTGSSILWQASRYNSIQPLSPWFANLVQNFVFKTTGELIFGAALMYYYRILERQTGSAKFGGYTFVVMGLSYGLQAAIKAAYSFEDFPSGPYGFIFASFLQFVFDIPMSRRFTAFGIPMSDKAFTYIMAFQLLLSRGKGSAMAALCGILAGFTYRSNIFRIKKFQFPGFINKLLANSIGRLLGGTNSRAIVSSRQISSRQRSTRNGSHNSAATLTISEDNVMQLVAMGFDESAARRALQLANNDVQSAIALLVERS